MPGKNFNHVTRWCFQAQIEEVAEILEDFDSLCEWWPELYVEARTLQQSPHCKVELLTKGKLPFMLRWEFTVAESNLPDSLTIDAEGDFVGRGAWRLVQNGPLAEVEFDWRVRPEKPVLKMFWWAVKPLFGWNHAWAMDQGEQCLCAEIKRRRRAAQTRELTHAI